MGFSIYVFHQGIVVSIILGTKGWRIGVRYWPLPHVAFTHRIAG